VACPYPFYIQPRIPSEGASFYSSSPMPPHHITTVLRLVFRDHPGEPLPEENFWTLWCKGRLTEADTLTIRLDSTPSRLTSAHLHHPPYFLQAGCPSCCPTNSVKALKATLRCQYNVIKYVVKYCAIVYSFTTDIWCSLSVTYTLARYWFTAK